MKLFLAGELNDGAVLCVVESVQRDKRRNRRRIRRGISRRIPFVLNYATRLSGGTEG